MRVVLIQPPIQDFYNTEVRLQPIGLCYLKAAVNSHLPDVEVIIKDYHQGHGRRTIAVPRELADLAAYYPVADKAPFAVFHQYYHFGLSFAGIAAELATLQPDLVGISALFTPYYREALAVAVCAKRRCAVPVVMGGAHVSAVPESVLSHPCVDYVIRGEGERALVELLHCLQGRRRIEEVPNLGYKRGGQLYFNAIEDNYAIDQLPFPDVSDFTPSAYTLAGKPLTFIITSRSCPHRCSFCSVHTTFGQTYRRRAIDNVLAEIDLRYRQGYRIMDFEDDNLTFYTRAFKELCRRLIARFPTREVEFVAMNGISYLSLDEELLELMYRAGFAQLNLALVSSDTAVRETTKRPHTIAAYLRVVRKAFQLGFRMVSYQILGLPQESLASMVQTLAFNARLPVLLGASPFYRTPHTPIARGLTLTVRDYVRARTTAMAVETELFTRDDIYTLFVSTRIINFLKGLDLPEAVALDDLVRQSWSMQRLRIGFTLLQQLAETGILYFWTRHGLIANTKFKPALFWRVLQETGQITCQNGRSIAVEAFVRSALARPEASGQHAAVGSS
jgi:radical SAM superfamily enzyme YgiQ (UPF0313 family)